MGDFKDKNGKSRLGMFIKKAGEIFPDILSAGTMLATGNVVGAVQSVSEALRDESIKDGESKLIAAEMLYQFELQKEEMALEAMRIKSEDFKSEVDDRKSARISGDKILQKTLAKFSMYGFAFFGALQMVIAFLTMARGYDVNEFVIMTTSNLFGIFTGLLFTLKDYAFGGSVKE